MEATEERHHVVYKYQEMKKNTKEMHIVIPHALTLDMGLRI